MVDGCRQSDCVLLGEVLETRLSKHLGCAHFCVIIFIYIFWLRSCFWLCRVILVCLYAKNLCSYSQRLISSLFWHSLTFLTCSTADCRNAGFSPSRLLRNQWLCSWHCQKRCLDRWKKHRSWRPHHWAGVKWCPLKWIFPCPQVSIIP